MQWHGHDDVELPPAKTFVVKRCAEPTCHEMSQVNLTPVLKFVYDLANNTPPTVRGHRCIKINGAMGAVGAGERGCDSPFEGLRALLAKRRNNTDGLRFALLAEIFSSSSFAAAKRAYRRVKKGCRRFKQFKLAKRDHILNRCALISK